MVNLAAPESGRSSAAPSRRARLACAAAILLTAAAGAVGLAHLAGAAVSQTLYASFDADGNIHLTYADGTSIGAPAPPGTVVPAGTYTIILNNNSLDDLGDPHQYHLFGPGVNLTAQAVQATWSATFQSASTYVFQDDLNPATQHEVFGTPGSGATSTTAPVTATTPANTSSGGSKSGGSSASKNAIGNTITSAPLTFRGTLIGTVSAAGKLTLTVKGKSVASLKSGRYKISVTDSTSKGGFTIQEIRKAGTTVSGIAFVGKSSKTVTLKPGQWFFYPTFVGKKTYFIVTR